MALIREARTVYFYWQCGKCGIDGLAPQTAVAVFEPWSDGVRVRHFECLHCKATMAAQLIETVNNEAIGSDTSRLIRQLVDKIPVDDFFRLLYTRQGKAFPASLPQERI